MNSQPLEGQVRAINSALSALKARMCGECGQGDNELARAYLEVLRDGLRSGDLAILTRDDRVDALRTILMGIPQSASDVGMPVGVETGVMNSARALLQLHPGS